MPTLKARLAWAMLNKEELREACQKEGLKVDWARLRRLAGVKEDGKCHKKRQGDPNAPHKQLAEEYIAHREAQRRHMTEPVAATPHPRDSTDKRSDSGDEGDERESIELDNLVAKEVREWRSEVNRSQTLRHREKPRASGSHSKQAVLKSPTHVLADPSIPSTPSTTMPSIEASPAPRVAPLREASSHSTLHLPPPVRHQGLGLLPTPTPSTVLSPDVPQRAQLSPGMIPSLSQSFPLELDHEHGVELLSAPSSRPDSPFSTFSRPLSPSVHGTNLSSTNYYSFSSPNTLSSAENALSPLPRPPSRSLSDLDFLSDMDLMSPRWTAAGTFAPYEDAIGDKSSNGSESSWGSADARSS
ncbi:hypothetical protein C0991_005377 [Blastosporella zonata]|nr:hypothetical protein C0991_005377 [Blastosporella zonata]